MNQQQQIQIRRPNRDTLRMVFDNALRSCSTDPAREVVASVMIYYEHVWEQEDKVIEEQKKNAPPPPPPPDDPPPPPDAENRKNGAAHKEKA